ncbi:hypothetical protein CEXT_603401 [Caerostris extrusa]|uniref:Uncharacterized protein n=1 Tax=Caerostris extrusa TaxID=172846 RepID=A0AAV4PU24_CAEEX|nr:hypothetical protein CEXT_603401 [Caerostris extrusa]
MQSQNHSCRFFCVPLSSGHNCQGDVLGVHVLRPSNTDRERVDSRWGSGEDCLRQKGEEKKKGEGGVGHSAQLWRLFGRRNLRGSKSPPFKGGRSNLGCGEGTSFSWTEHPLRDSLQSKGWIRKLSQVGKCFGRDAVPASHTRTRLLNLYV